jgi:peptidoglycan/xylan/chitin deacetylase (PgdA/CDA1 family)
MSSTGHMLDTIGDEHLKRPPLAARLSHRMARHIPLRLMRMRGGPILTITFDDVPETALTEGARLLEAENVRGTFYVAGGQLGQQMDDWRVIDADGVAALHARGHEIGCHSFAHRRIDWTDYRFFVDDIARNRERLLGIAPGLHLENFAFPFGYTSFSRKPHLAKMFHSARTITPGCNSGLIDPHFLRATPLYSDRIDESCIERALDAAQAKSGWLIFFTHDVANRPSEYGCTPKLLEHTLRAAKARGVPSLNMAEALARISAG